MKREDAVQMTGAVVYLSCCMHRGSNCPLLRAADGGIMRRGTTSSCQSTATSKIVEHCCSPVYSCKQRYGKYSNLFTFTFTEVAEWYGAGLAIARSRVRIPPTVAVYQRQLSVPSLRGRLMSTSGSWEVNGHTTRCTSPVSVVLQLRLVSG